MGEPLTPRTVAGRTWHDRLHNGVLDPCDYLPMILAIEDVFIALDAARAAAPGLDEERLVEIIEQAIFETDTGLAAAMLAAERITEAARRG